MRNLKKISICILSILSVLVCFSPVFATEETYYAYFGYYPQSVVEDTALYDELFFLGDEYLVEGMEDCYRYDNKCYMRYQTGLFQEDSYFTNGSPIISNRVYFFLIEPILWNVYNLEDNLYYSNKILDCISFTSNSDVSFNYDSSSLQQYLNQKASELQVLNSHSDILMEFEMNHSSIYQHADSSTFELQLMGSEYLNELEDLKAMPTDFALAKGLDVEVIEEQRYGAYWSSAYGSYSDTMMYVDEEGTFLYNKKIGETCGIRPMIRRMGL